MVFAAAENQPGCYRNEPGRPDSGVVNKATKSTYLHSKEQIDRAFLTYADAICANAELLLEESPLQATWTRILSALPRCSSVRFVLVEPAEVGLDLQPLYPECVTKPIGATTNTIYTDPRDTIRSVDSSLVQHTY